MSEVYLGNPNLKKANTQIQFSAEQIEEFVKCKNNPVYFAQKYVKIVSLDEGLVPFKPYKFQEKLIKRFHKNRFKLERKTFKHTNVLPTIHTTNKRTSNF